MDSKTGTIFDIQRFSVHDGPGIRTTVFFKGCPLNCTWCHNPEGLSPHPQLQFHKDKCLGCLRCVSCCQRHTIQDGRHSINFQACTLCGNCISVCPSGALSSCGKKISADEVMEVVERDMPFYRESGGLTLSGGECLQQPAFALELLKRSKEKGIHTAIDTSGFVKWDVLTSTLEDCDLYLYDMKCMSSDLHKDFTGQENGMILDNLKKLSQTGKPIWIRIPVIPGVNDTKENMAQAALFLKGLQHIQQVTLMPYHTLGKSKYETLGLCCGYSAPSDNGSTKEDMDGFKQLFYTYGIQVK